MGRKRPDSVDSDIYDKPGYLAAVSKIGRERAGALKDKLFRLSSDRWSTASQYEGYLERELENKQYNEKIRAAMEEYLNIGPITFLQEAYQEQILQEVKNELKSINADDVSINGPYSEAEPEPESMEIKSVFYNSDDSIEAGFEKFLAEDSKFISFKKKIHNIQENLCLIMFFTQSLKNADGVHPYDSVLEGCYNLYTYELCNRKMDFLRTIDPMMKNKKTQTLVRIISSFELDNFSENLTKDLIEQIKNIFHHNSNILNNPAKFMPSRRPTMGRRPTITGDFFKPVDGISHDDSSPDDFPPMGATPTTTPISASPVTGPEEHPGGPILFNMRARRKKLIANAGENTKIDITNQNDFLPPPLPYLLNDFSQESLTDKSLPPPPPDDDGLNSSSKTRLKK